MATQEDAAVAAERRNFLAIHQKSLSNVRFILHEAELHLIHREPNMASDALGDALSEVKKLQKALCNGKSRKPTIVKTLFSFRLWRRVTARRSRSEVPRRDDEEQDY